MAWDHLSINKPHLVYIILGGFTSLFMLCSSVIKERLYIGEATVATICGIIFGPHAANLIDPLTWGNTDQITLEFSRIVLVVQCFAVGVELPRSYMEKHWRSVSLLLVPVMTWGWLITSLCIWWMFHDQMNWLDSLIVAACVTATDPVLASSVVGKGKFARRIPKHLRDLLSAESGCNDGMAFPFIYLALYITRYRPDTNKVAFHWFCYTILYECVFGAFYGVVLGYLARRAIRYAHEKDFIDRESFLVFYFVLALFCAGSGSILGLDDLLVGFAAGVGFSNDGWFLEKTEESHVSNVIDLLLNLTFFVYFGTIIPWAQFNTDILGIHPWRLVVLGILVLFFRRIPIMLLLKPAIPDLKTWREALFAGHFGPIGVGAIFVCILARAELETEGTTPLAELPPPDYAHMNVIEMIWPITCFIVITSIIVHGSSIAVFTLGKRINTLTLTLSYTQDVGEGPGWMDRLPRIQSRSKSQVSMRRAESVDSAMDEKGEINGLAIPKNFLRRQREEDVPSRSSSARPFGRRRRDPGYGGPISQSAVEPMSMRQSLADVNAVAPSGDLGKDVSPASPAESEGSDKAAVRSVVAAGLPPEVKDIYHEGSHFVFEDRDGNVLGVTETRGENDEERLRHAQEDLLAHLASRGDEESRGRPGSRERRPSLSSIKRSLSATGRSLSARGRSLSLRGRTTSLEKKKEEPNKREEDPAGKAKEKAKEKTMGKTMGKTRGKLGTKPEENPEEPVQTEPASRDHQHRTWQDLRRRLGQMAHHEAADGSKEKEPNRGPASAYQYGNTIILEDENGEVIKKIDIPVVRKTDPSGAERRVGVMDPNAWKKVGGLFGGQRPPHHPEVVVENTEKGEAGPASTGSSSAKKDHGTGGDRLRFRVAGGGRKMSTSEFIETFRQLEPKQRIQAISVSDAPEDVKRKVKADAIAQQAQITRGDPKVKALETGRATTDALERRPQRPDAAHLQHAQSQSSEPEDEEVPIHPIAGDLARVSFQHGSGAETAASRRRRLVARVVHADADQSDHVSRAIGSAVPEPSCPDTSSLGDTDGETAAERKRREDALGLAGTHEDSESEEDDGPPPARQGITFAEPRRPAPSDDGEEQPQDHGSKRGRKLRLFSRK